MKLPSLFNARTAAAALTTGITTGIALGSLAGCASPPDRYYTLATPADARLADAAAPGLVVEVLPVTVPERLARPQMLVRKGVDSAELALLDQHRWSSSFESELRDALAAGIAEQLGAVDASKAPRSGGGPVWRIAVQVRRFELVEGRGVDAAFAWTLRRSDSTTLGLTCLAQETVPAAPGIDALANSARQATAHLADAIAGAVRSARAADAGARECPKPPAR